jgi:hypothetical protein
MAEALSRLIPNADGRLILVIRHRQVYDPVRRDQELGLFVSKPWVMKITRTTIN